MARRRTVVVIEHDGGPLDPELLEDLLHENLGHWVKARVEMLESRVD